jgi:agmatinase
VGADDLGFLEDKLDGVDPSSEGSGFVVSLVPYEETTTYKTGTRYGPRAIVDASGHMELLDETLRVDASSFGILTLNPDISDLGSITRHAADAVNSYPDALHGFLGGEHSVTPAILEGIQKSNMGIVWIDAHADLRREYRGREDNHACAGFNSVRFGPIVQIGIRSLCAEEADFLDTTDRVRSFRNWNDQVKDAIRGLPKDIYLSVDMDGFSPMLVRGVGTPEPGGLSWSEMMGILDFLFEEKDVFAYDVVELLPHDDDVVSSYTAARLVYKIMNYHTHHKLRGRVPPLA